MMYVELNIRYYPHGKKMYVSWAALGTTNWTAPLSRKQRKYVSEFQSIPNSPFSHLTFMPSGVIRHDSMTEVINEYINDAS